MAAESPKMSPATPRSRAAEEPISKSLFYAYARRSDYAQFSPYLLTFVNADVARQWWELVRQEYPDSTREGTQLFTFKGDDIPGQIWDNRKFERLKNKWFYSHFGDTSGTGGIIPLQDEKGNLLGQPIMAPVPSDGKLLSPDGGFEKNFDFSALQSNLEKLHSMVEQNANQIKALSVAQSDGLQRMQEINETNASQIKALADGQAKLQSLVEQNASHYIAITNTQFSNQEQIKTVLQQNADYVKTLAEGQGKLASACNDMMGAITQLSQCVSSPPMSENSNGCGHIVSPPPRKLNRRVMAYTYEEGTPASPRSSITVVSAPLTPGK